MKKLLITFALTIGINLFLPDPASAGLSGGVTVTTATGGNNISADKAANASSPGFTTLGDIVMAERSASDLSAGNNVTLILTAPSGWSFKAGVGSVSAQTLRDISAASISVSASTITITYTVSGTANLDTMTISGIQVQSADGAALPSSGTILRTSANPGTAGILGITLDTTSFGSLSQTVGTAIKLAFSTEPGSAVAGAIFGVQPVVETQDQFGNNSAIGLPSSRIVTLSLSAGTGPLQGTLTSNIGTSAGNGTVSFTDLRIDIAGTNKQLTAAASTFTSAISAFTVGPATANRITIQTQPPATATAGLPFAAHPVIRIEDIYGNLRINDNGIVITVARNAGLGTLQGILTAPTTNGVATFTNLSHKVANTINLIFTCTDLPSIISSNIVVSPGTANQLVFSTQPGGAVVNSNLVTQLVVKTQDSFGNDSTVNLAATKNVLMTLTSGPGSLLGTTTLNIGTSGGNGIVVYTNLRITAANSADQLTASASSFGSITSILFAVTKANQTITFGNLANKCYGDAPFTLDATASSGLPVSYSIVSGPATISSNLVTITGTGTVTVEALQGGDNNWNAAASIDQSFTVALAVLTITADNKFKVYGDTNPPLTLTYSGFVNGENPSFLTGSPTLSTSVTTNSPVVNSPYIIAINTNELSSTNYTFNVVDGRLTVGRAALVGTADDKTRAYGETNPVFTVIYTGFVNNENSSVVTGELVGTTTATTNSPTGNYPIHASGQSAANYTIAYNDGNLTVIAAFLFVDADDQVRLYGATNPVFTGNISGLKNNDFMTATYDTPATTNSPIDGYPIIPTLVDPNNQRTNYSVIYDNGTLTILPAPLLGRVDNKNRAYGTTNPIFTVTYSGFVNGEDASIVREILITSTPATTNSSIGTYPVSATGQRAPNYAITFVDGTLTVTNTLLTITAVDKSRLYGQVNPTFTASFSGFVNNDNQSVLNGILTFNTEANQSSPVGPYSIVPSGLTSTNYSIVYSNGTLTVTTYTLTVVANDSARGYGATNPVFTGSLIGVQDSDGITADYTSTAGTNSPIETYSIVPHLNDPNHRLENYTVYLTNGTLTVTQVSLVVTANNTNRNYGAVNPQFTGIITGIKNNDDITASYTSSAVAQTPTGNYPIVPSLIDPGHRLANYVAVTNNGTLTINPAPLLVKADDKSRIYHTPNPTFTGGITGFVNGEGQGALSGALVFNTSADINTSVGQY